MSMDDPTIKKVLSALRVPAVSESTRERARYHALTAFRNTPESASSFPFRKLSFAFGGLVVLLVAWLVATSLPKTADNSRLFTEIEKLFPGQFVAAIKDNDSVDLQLSPTPATVSNDQRIILSFRRGDHLIKVLTYSGNEVCLNLNGQKICATPLVQSDGNVLLMTNQEIFNGTHHAEIAGFKLSMEYLKGASS
ncbi:MAG: hypothetical protein ABIP97_03995 [Chthoniobacterales bacterium]